MKVAGDRGFLSGNHSHNGDDEYDTEDGFLTSYKWMRSQMAKRIPDFTGDYPVWAWPKKPSGRPLPFSYGPMVRVTCLVPRRRIVLSDYDMFTTVLNNGTNDVDGDAPMPPESTWEKIFDLSPRIGPMARDWRQPSTIQVCVDRIYLDEIVDVREMLSRPKHRRTQA